MSCPVQKEHVFYSVSHLYLFSATALQDSMVTRIESIQKVGDMNKEYTMINNEILCLSIISQYNVSFKVLNHRKASFYIEVHPF